MGQLNAIVTNRLEDIMSKYDDIINLPHHVSKTRKPMSMVNRAAQFAPFAALSGHDAAIAETARLTIEKPELSMDELNKLSRRLVYATKRELEVRITYFHPDALKLGGSTIEVEGRIRTVDQLANQIVLTNHLTIPLDHIIRIENDQFDILEL